MVVVLVLVLVFIVVVFVLVLTSKSSCGLENVLVLRIKVLKGHCFTSKCLKIVFISVAIVLNHSRQKCFQKIYDDQNRDVVLVSSQSESLFSIRKERRLADVIVRSRNTNVDMKFV